MPWHSIHKTDVKIEKHVWNGLHFGQTHRLYLPKSEREGISKNFISYVSNNIKRHFFKELQSLFNITLDIWLYIHRGIMITNVQCSQSAMLCNFDLTQQHHLPQSKEQKEYITWLGGDSVGRSASYENSKT